MEKTKSFICFEMLEVKKFDFLCFQVENKVTNMYKTFCLHLTYLMNQLHSLPRVK